MNNESYFLIYLNPDAEIRILEFKDLDNVKAFEDILYITKDVNEAMNLDFTNLLTSKAILIKGKMLGPGFIHQISVE